MDKLVVIINGKGGVGKDTICEIVSKHYTACSYSTIDDVKRAAILIGWNGSKELKDRSFLSELKSLCSKYYDFPFKQSVSMYEHYLKTDYQVMFFHVREPEEINKHKKYIEHDGRTRVVTLLIERDTAVKSYGNRSDDGVSNYKYDFVFRNNCGLEKLEKRFIDFWKRNIVS